ncbi:hypothetical protein ACE6H2_021808 [Prunus campanulata]
MAPLHLPLHASMHPCMAMHSNHVVNVCTDDPRPTLAPNPTACTLLPYPFLPIHGLAAAHSGAGEVKVALTAIVANHLVVNLTLAAEGAIGAASRVGNTEIERPVLLGSDD